MSPRRPQAFVAPACLQIAAVVLLLLACACSSTRNLSGPSSASDPFVLKGLDGEAVAPLQESSRSAVCLLLVRTDCPISNRYAPEVLRLAAAFADTLDCWLVYCDPDETAAQIEAHRAAYGYPFPALRDPEQRCAASIGALVTPEVAVFDSRRELVYVGRIDDRFADFGKTRPAPTERDLEDVLRALASGTELEFRRTQAVGCPLPEPRP